MSIRIQQGKFLTQDDLDQAYAQLYARTHHIEKGTRMTRLFMFLERVTDRNEIDRYYEEREKKEIYASLSVWRKILKWLW